MVAKSTQPAQPLEPAAAAEGPAEAMQWLAPLEENGSTDPIPSERQWFGRSRELLRMPHLIEVQLRSFEWFRREGLRELFAEISPIADFTGKNLELELAVGAEPFGAPKWGQDECRDRDMTYAAPLYCEARLLNKQTQEIKESRIFMGDFPVMTAHGTFIVNGAERVVVSQLVRSPGVYFTAEEDPATGRRLFAAKLIPNRGAWLEFETSAKDLLTVKVDRKRKLPVTTLLRALAPEYGTDEALLELFAADDTDPERRFIEATIGLGGGARRDPARSHAEGLLEVYRRLRPGDPATPENARNLVQSLFFNPRRYDLGRVGRYKLNKRLKVVGRPERTLTPEDLVAIVRQLLLLNRDQGRPDDIDHLGNRRIRAVGELIQNQFRIGLLRMERVIKERMTIQDPESATPAALVNIRPVVAAMKEFFGGSQLSQFMDQTNPLAELTHKRRLSALGPGGLSRERAGFDVRDVHESHYGRICPVETPEGPNIGLIGSLATYGRINDYGFIETPYRKVHRAVVVTAQTDPEELARRMLTERQLKALPAPAESPLTTALATTGAGSPHRGRDGRRPGQAGREGRGLRAGRAPLRHGRGQLPPRGRRRELRRGPGQHPPGRQSESDGDAHRRPLPGRVPGRPRGAGGPDGRLPQADRLRRRRPDPLPGARRRQPGPHGGQHAAPGGAPAAAPGAPGGHRGGGPGRARLGPGGAGPGPRRRGQGRARRRWWSWRTGRGSPGATRCAPSCAPTRAPASRSAPWCGRGSGWPPGRPWRTACPPPGGSWPWGRTCWGPSCSGRGATSRTPS